MNKEELIGRYLIDLAKDGYEDGLQRAMTEATKEYRKYEIDSYYDHLLSNPLALCNSFSEYHDHMKEWARLKKEIDDE